MAIQELPVQCLNLLCSSSVPLVKHIVVCSDDIMGSLLCAHVGDCVTWLVAPLLAFFVD